MVTLAGTTSTRVIQPISTPSEAISVQQQALTSVTPSSEAESLAVTTQQDLLSNYTTLERQQAVVDTRLVTTQSAQLVSPQSADASAEASAEAQISALATTETRDKLVSAVQYAVNMWRLQAHFQNITIMGQTAIGNPGCLAGPELLSWFNMAPTMYNATGYLNTLGAAVGQAVTGHFSQWQNGVTVPGLPWYPMFVAVAAPFAPPTPNIPMPLIVCVSAYANKLMSPYQLETAILANLPAEFHIAAMDTFVHALSVALTNYFTTWLCSQNVMMVMGMGPVPTFAPPYVPVGAVMNGYVIPSPGHLAA